MRHDLKLTAALIGVCIISTIMNLGPSANAQTAEELKRYMEINKNNGKAADDIIRGINGPQRDTSIGVYTDQERLQLVIDAFKIKKNDGGASRREFLEKFEQKNTQKQREREAAEAYKREWIVKERARQKVEVERGAARERAASAARAEERRQIQTRNERAGRARTAAAIAKRDAYEAEKKRKIAAHTAVSRQRSQNTVTAGTTSGYADDGLEDLPPPLTIVEPKNNENADTPGFSVPEGCANSLLGVQIGEPDDYDENGCYITPPEPDPSSDSRNWQGNDWYLYGEGPCHVSKNTVSLGSGTYSRYLTSGYEMHKFSQKCQSFIRKKKETICPGQNSGNCTKAVEFKFLPCLMSSKDTYDFVMAMKNYK